MSCISCVCLVYVSCMSLMFCVSCVCLQFFCRHSMSCMFVYVLWMSLMFCISYVCLQLLCRHSMSCMSCVCLVYVFDVLRILCMSSVSL